MSATRDKTQKIGFVYTNLYELYKKGAQEKPIAATAKEQAIKKEDAYFPSETAQVLKAKDLEDLKKSAKVEVKPFHAPQFKNTNDSAEATMQRLKDNLIKLHDIHAKLRFMLQEIDENTRGSGNGSSSNES